MFYWSYENFKMVECEFEKRIKECKSFLPLPKNNLEHGMFVLEDNSTYYILEGMLGFHIFRTNKPVSEESCLFLFKEDGTVSIVDKESSEFIKMERVMGLPLEICDDVIPKLVHDEEDLPGSKHCVVVGHDPEDEDDMICLQEYHDGYRTVWISAETYVTPIVIDDNRYSLHMPEELNDLFDYVDSSRERIEEAAEDSSEVPEGLKDFIMYFVYEGKFYKLVCSAFDEFTPAMFHIVGEPIKRLLIEAGADYVSFEVVF